MPRNKGLRPAYKLSNGDENKVSLQMQSLIMDDIKLGKSNC